MDSVEPVGFQARETLRVNYFATRELCDTLFPLLRPHARVVNLSSAAGWLGRIPSPELRKRFANPDLSLEELNSLMDEFIE